MWVYVMISESVGFCHDIRECGVWHQENRECAFSVWRRTKNSSRTPVVYNVGLFWAR